MAECGKSGWVSTGHSGASEGTARVREEQMERYCRPPYLTENFGGGERRAAPSGGSGGGDQAVGSKQREAKAVVTGARQVAVGTWVENVRQVDVDK